MGAINLENTMYHCCFFCDRALIWGVRVLLISSGVCSLIDVCWLAIDDGQFLTAIVTVIGTLKYIGFPWDHLAVSVRFLGNLKN